MKNSIKMFYKRLEIDMQQYLMYGKMQLIFENIYCNGIAISNSNNKNDLQEELCKLFKYYVGISLSDLKSEFSKNLRLFVQ